MDWLAANIWWILGSLLMLAVVVTSIIEGDKLHKAKHVWCLAGLAAAENLRQNPPGGVFYQIRESSGGGKRFWIGKWTVKDPVSVPSFRRWVPDPFVPEGDYQTMFGPSYGGMYFTTAQEARAYLMQRLKPAAPKPEFRECYDAGGEQVICV